MPHPLSVLGGLVRSTVPLLRSAAPANVDVSVAVPDHAIVVAGNETALRQMLVNLVLNGAQAMEPDGGLVQVEVSSEADSCTLRVRDEGVGIPDSLQREIFEPRYSTKGRGGRGLCLAVVRRAVDAHGGRIEVSSRSGAGATFTVSLHLAESSAGLRGAPS